MNDPTVFVYLDMTVNTFKKFISNIDKIHGATIATKLIRIKVVLMVCAKTTPRYILNSNVLKSLTA